MSEPTHLPRLYDEKEVTRLLKRATELQREEPVRAAGGGGLSREHGQPSLLGRSLTWQGETANKPRSLPRPSAALLRLPPLYLLPRPKRRRRGRLLSCSPPTAAVLAVFAAARALSSAFRARMAAMRSPSGTSSGTSGVAS